MKSILVTGGLGYIGAHTVVELEKAGYEPIIVDDLSNTDHSMLDRLEAIIRKKLTFYQLDINRSDHLREVFEDHEIHAVIHFAASKAVGESVKKPLLYYRNNIGGTVALLEVMKASGVGSFIFSSSCTVYGEPETLPVTEQSPIKPANSPYGNTKQICEEVIRDEVLANDTLKAISLRYFNPVGAHDSAKIGELPKGVPNNLLPYLPKVVAGELEELAVFGDDYNTSDGTAIRDYIHVVDLAKAHVIALNRLINKENKKDYEVFNLGTGEGYSVLQLIETFEKVTGEKVKYKVVNRREGDIEKIYADTSFANDELGWKAELGLKEMLDSAWKWQKELSR